MDNRQTKCLFTISVYGEMLSLANSFSPWRRKKKKHYIPDQDWNKIHSDRKGFCEAALEPHFHSHISTNIFNIPAAFVITRRDLELCLNKQKYY